jgi:hypothetical protein
MFVSAPLQASDGFLFVTQAQFHQCQVEGNATCLVQTKFLPALRKIPPPILVKMSGLR